jgi:hypothetical protein
MKTLGKGPTRLEEALKCAYQEKKSPEIGEKWRRKLMARVREIGPIYAKPLFLPSFEKFVWRLVPVTTPLALILIFFLIKLGLSSGHDPLQSFVNGIEEWTLSQFFAV